jgi:hypothetical protein
MPVAAAVGKAPLVDLYLVLLAVVLVVQVHFAAQVQSV